MLAGCSEAPSEPGPDAGSAPVADSGAPADAGSEAEDASRPLTDAGAPRDDDASVPALDLPPTDDRDALEAWLAEGRYLGWNCEEAPHPARPPGAHRANRICTNDVLSEAPLGAFPRGSAAVKELYDAAGAINGYAVSVKLDDESASGNGWYWYERIGARIYADGRGETLCTSCHAGAGTGFAPTARDYVFTVVP